MILLMTAVEFAATGALVICWFQGLSAGKSDCPSKVSRRRSSRISIAPARLALAASRRRREGLCTSTGGLLGGMAIPRAEWKGRGRAEADHPRILFPPGEEEDAKLSLDGQRAPGEQAAGR